MGFVIEKDIRRNAEVRRRLLWDGAHVKGAARDIRSACANDVLFFVNYFCFTFDPRKKQSVIPFVTYGFQDDAILEVERAISGGYDVCIGKSRDMGASWINIVVPVHQFLFSGSTRNFLMVSRNESYVDDSGNPKSLFWKIDFIRKHVPTWLLPRSVVRRSMHIENSDTGSVIDGESTTGEVARGDRRTAILLDEFASFDTKAGYNALTATQSATYCRIFNSTPKGTQNAFHDVFKRSSAKIVTMHWSQHPEKNVGLYCSSRNEKTGRMELKLMSDWRGVVDFCEKGTKKVVKCAFPEDYPFILDGKMRSPWYDRECSRAVNQVEISQELDIDFFGSEYQFFDPIAIERYKDKWCSSPDSVGDVEIDGNGCEVLRFTQNPKGCFSLFEPLNRQGRVERERRFVIGVDVSAGTGASNSTIVVYDRNTREKVAEYANPKTLPDDFGRFVVAVAKFYNDALVVPDRSGPTGEVLVRRMIAEGYSNLYYANSHNKDGSRKSDKPGVFLNPVEKTTVLQQYRDAIGRVSVVNRSERAMDECLRFVMTQNGNVEHSSESNSNDPSGARSNHGDLVIADALATVAMSDASSSAAPEPVETPRDSLAWRMEMARRICREKVKSDLGGSWEV